MFDGRVVATTHGDTEPQEERSNCSNEELVMSRRFFYFLLSRGDEAGNRCTGMDV